MDFEGDRVKQSSTVCRVVFKTGYLCAIKSGVEEIESLRFRRRGNGVERQV